MPLKYNPITGEFDVIEAAIATAGGNANYPLAKYDSTATYPFIGFNAYAGITGNVAITDSRLYLTPITFGVDLTLTELSVYVTTGVAGSTARLGIYTSDSDGLPDSVLLDAGTVATATSSAAATISVSQAVTGGEMYYSAIVVDENAGAVSMRGCYPCTAFMTDGYAPLMQFYQSGVSAGSALPDPLSLTGNLQVLPPTLFFKI